MKKLLKPAAVPLRLENGKTIPVLHPNPGDAISINNEPKTDILGYAHTPDGMNVYLPGEMHVSYRAHKEYPEGQSREYFLKKMPRTISEFNLLQVQHEIIYYPAETMWVSYSKDRELPIIHGESDTKNAA